MSSVASCTAWQSRVNSTDRVPLNLLWSWVRGQGSRRGDCNTTTNSISSTHWQASLYVLPFRNHVFLCRYQDLSCIGAPCTMISFIR